MPDPSTTQADAHADRAPVNDPASPLVLVILDGFGVRPPGPYNAVTLARTPFFDQISAGSLPGVTLERTLTAHGPHVGLAADTDMGNSEVGHNILGAGRVFDQGAKQVQAALDTGTIWGETWRTAVSRASTGTLHIVGLLSDGNVHAHIAHLEALCSRAALDGVRRVRAHVLLDGRDVPDHTAHEYLARFEAHLAGLEAAHGGSYRVASGGGRQRVTMDRYGADWAIVARGYRAHVLGDAARFPSAREALASLRSATPGVSDQDLDPFVIADEHGPIGAMRDGDAVVLANFRGDRMLELYEALTASSFPHFDRPVLPDLHVVGMTLWDGDRGWPEHRLVTPARVDDTASEVLARAGVTQLAVAETQKFGHVTYFWNGNRSEPFDPRLEEYVLIESHPDPLAHPAMRSAETATAVADAVRSGRWAFVRTNLAAGDMVGHTGNLAAAVAAVEALDAALAVIHTAVAERAGTLIILADHGNCEEMALTDGDGTPLVDASGAVRPKTSHTLSPVPFVVVDSADRHLRLAVDPDMGLANVAASLLSLLGVPVPPSYAPPVLVVGHTGTGTP